MFMGYHFPIRTTCVHFIPARQGASWLCVLIIASSLQNRLLLCSASTRDGIGRGFPPNLFTCRSRGLPPLPAAFPPVLVWCCTRGDPPRRIGRASCRERV